jgi:hypothetical protein
MGLAKQTNITPIEWATNTDDYNKNPDYYVAKCRDWWEKEGKNSYLSLENSLKHFNEKKSIKSDIK